MRTGRHTNENLITSYSIIILDSTGKLSLVKAKHDIVFDCQYETEKNANS